MTFQSLLGLSSEVLGFILQIVKIISLQIMKAKYILEPFKKKNPYFSIFVV